VVALALIALSSCRKSTPGQVPGTVSSAKAEPAANAPGSARDVERGQLLAAKWCGTCHLAPDPSDLPRERWHFIIKWMGNYLGYPNDDKDLQHIVYRSLVASQPAITFEEFRAIETYFVTKAPEQIVPAFDRDQPPATTTLFTPEQWPGYEQAKTISLVKVDDSRRRLYLGSAEDSLLCMFSSTGHRMARINCSQNQAIKVRPTAEGFDLVLIGSIGIDNQQGTVHKISGTGTIPGPLRSERIVEGFFRTSGADWGDLDGDGYEDLVMAGFGDDMFGALSWFSLKPGQPANRHDLRLGSGTIDAVIDDVDHDGDQDILAIIAQGNQDMWWFENEGRGEFHPRMLWKERPSMGYNGFQWIDFNGDGKKDVIAVSGNNMEMFDPPLKSLHGVYVYLQTAPMQFTKTYFLRMDGATKVIAADFDGDGDMDIAAISAYPDWRAKRPVTFALFTKEGHGKFTPSTIPADVSGQFITMDAGDLDGDGDIDIVLGGAGWPPLLPEPLLSSVKEKLVHVPAVIVLRNQSLPRPKPLP
jgi:FG-GAP-like repeat